MKETKVLESESQSLSNLSPVKRFNRAKTKARATVKALAKTGCFKEVKITLKAARPAGQPLSLRNGWRTTNQPYG